MKITRFSTIALCLFLLFNVLTTVLEAQTAGNLTFSCGTAAPSGTWGNKHVLAIWIENVQNPSIFIKTKAKYGNEDDHLTLWKPKSNGSTVDATTGATLTSYGAQSIIWDGTDVSKKVVADGDYKVFIEMGWGSDKVNQHSSMSFTFTKSSNIQNIVPTGTINYTNVTLNWSPVVTLVSNTKANKPVTVYPNPTSGLVTLNFSGIIAAGEIVLINSQGATLQRRKIERKFSGLYPIDLSSFADGLYFIKVASPEYQYTFEVLLKK